MAPQITRTVRDIFDEACALQRQGVHPFEVGKQLQAIGRDAGYAEVKLISPTITGTDVTVDFAGYGRIWFDGADWQCKLG
jgi:hypothetical protein